MMMMNTFPPYGHSYNLLPLPPPKIFPYGQFHTDLYITVMPSEGGKDIIADIHPSDTVYTVLLGGSLSVKFWHQHATPYQ